MVQYHEILQVYITSKKTESIFKGCILSQWNKKDQKNTMQLLKQTMIWLWNSYDKKKKSLFFESLKKA